jgi:type II pantothenate kinase
VGSVGRVVGVDVGATLCKVVPLDAPAAGAHFPSTSLDEVRDAVLTHDPRRVGVTGGGAGGLALGRVAVAAVGEFDAWASGAPLLAAADGVALPARYLLVSVGTGTSVLSIGAGSPRRVGGTAVGGGTLMGLGRLLTGVTSFAELATLAAAGDRRNVDLLVGDVYREAAGPLLGDLTAANFGRVRSAQHADLAAALATLVGETVALVSVGLARAEGVDTVVYCGSTLAGNPALVDVVVDIATRFGATPRLLAAGQYCGAVGAAALAAASR